MQYIIRDLETGKIFEWSLREVLHEINRDHSDEFTPYDKSDWREGWDEWCEGDLYALMEESG